MIDVELSDYLERAKVKSFEWGVCDCAIFVCDWIEERIGINPASICKGAYTTEAEATAFMLDHFGSLSSGLDAEFTRVEKAFRQKGDVALCKIEGRETLGIVGGCGFVFFKSLGKGIVAKREPEILTVWRVE